MSTILDKIVATKRQELVRDKADRPLSDWVDSLAGLPPCRPFAASLRQPGIRVIAEVKKASPSKGVIRADFDPVRLATDYSNAGAAAISVLTDRDYFQGDLAYLEAVRKAVDTPLLRKDFTIDDYQIYEARRAGADAILLIAAILDDRQITGLMATANELGLAVLLEVHTAEERDRAVALGAPIIGINNRDLNRFETSLDTTYQLLDGIPKETIRISESGIHEPAQVQALHAAGVDAILVGESLMRQPHVGEALTALVAP